MQISQMKTDDTTIAKYAITVPAQDVATAITEKLTKYGKGATIAGFRKGKTPLSVLQKRYGKEAMHDYINDTVQKSVEDIAKQNDLKVAMQPNVEIKSAGVGETLEFEIAYTLLPEIDLIDVSTLKLTTIKAKVDDSQVDAYIDQLAKQSRDSETVARPAQDGDMVVLDFAGSVDGVAFEGGTASDHSLELGSGSFIPGFEDQLVGVQAGDSKDITVTFPEEYQAKDLVGKQAVFACTIKQVKAFKDAVIDDAMAKKFGLESLDALKQGVAQQFSDQFSRETRSLVKKDIMDAFDDAHKFAIPQAMLDQEFNDMWTQIEKAQQSGQLDAEDEAKSDDELKQQYMELADRRVRLGLILTHIATEWKIEVSQDDVNQAIMQEAQRYPGQETQVFEYYQKNPQVVEQLRAPILEEKVVDAILEKADVTEKEMTADEIEQLLTAEQQGTHISAQKPNKAKATKTTAKKSKTKKSDKNKTTAKKSNVKKSKTKKSDTKKSDTKKTTANKSKAKKSNVKKATVKKATTKKA